MRDPVLDDLERLVVFVAAHFARRAAVRLEGLRRLFADAGRLDRRLVFTRIRHG